MSESWTPTDLRSICGPSGMQTGPFGGQLHAHEYTDDGVPVIMPKDMVSGRVSSESVARIRPAKAASLGVHKCQVGDILFGRRGDIGRCALITRSETGWICGTGSLRARPRDGVVRSEFLAHVVQAPHAAAWLLEHAVGQTMLNLNTRILGDLPIDLPPLPEQQRIAEILDTLDEAIRKTEQVIAKLQQVKQGLLHDLLTRGIDEHGELRDPDRHPEQFKDSELGRVPRAWEVGRLGERIADVRYGTSAPCDQAKGTHLVLRIPNVQAGELDLADLKYCFPTRDDATRYRVDVGDVLVIRTNGNPRLLGRCAAVLSAGDDWMFASYIIRVRFMADRVVPRFAARLVNGPVGRRHIETVAATSAGNYNINIVQLKAMVLPFPGIEEQEKMLEIASEHEASLGVQISSLAKLAALKSALMHDLLTGRVRTTP